MGKDLSSETTDSFGYPIEEVSEIERLQREVSKLKSDAIAYREEIAWQKEALRPLKASEYLLKLIQHEPFGDKAREIEWEHGGEAVKWMKAFINGFDRHS